MARLCVDISRRMSEVNVSSSCVQCAATARPAREAADRCYLFSGGRTTTAIFRRTPANRAERAATALSAICTFTWLDAWILLDTTANDRIRHCRVPFPDHVVANLRLASCLPVCLCNYIQQYHQCFSFFYVQILKANRTCLCVCMSSVEYLSLLRHVFV